ncbi:hypothetical protein GOODEAATRI_018832 [Goodea atripinnis]|uniref:Uncharacterized protein n=1 Tax=Goodea atripinnis TaxID=208336 RepID=A0ABV0PF98_9TELE
MASNALQALVLFFFHFSGAQTIIGSSTSFTTLNLPSNSPSPTKQTVRFWPSLPPRGRSDVPIKVTIRERFTALNAVEQGQRMALPTTQFNPSFIFKIPQNLSMEQISTQPTSSRPRTDTASLAFSRALQRQEAATKSPTPPLPTLPSHAGHAEERSIKGTEDGDSQGLGSGRAPTETSEKGKSTVLPAIVAEEMAQYRPQAQTMVSKVTDKETTSLYDQNDETYMLGLTTTSAISTTPHQRPKTAELTGKHSIMRHIFMTTCLVMFPNFLPKQS